jgi:Sulfotransferase family
MKKPLFIVGCPRSGTTFLYDLLLSSGKFALYQAESDVFFRIAPAFGSLKSRSNRMKLMDAWLESDYFRRSGLNAGVLRAKVLSECRNPGDLLRIVMEGIAREQGVRRWADNTPFHVLYLGGNQEDYPKRSGCSHHSRRPRCCDVIESHEVALLFSVGHKASSGDFRFVLEMACFARPGIWPEAGF